jgi:hypothetical protein
MPRSAGAPRHVKVTKNQWGNMKGHYYGLPFARELGCDDHRATEWVMDQLDRDPTLVIHPKSYITAQMVADLRKRLG